MKRCLHCGERKPLDQFYGDRAARDGHRPECKDCTSARRSEWYRRNRERELDRVRRWQRDNAARYAATQRQYRQLRRSEERAGHLRRAFGLSLDDYDRMLAEQDGVCAICGREPRTGTHLHVDHDHDTGRVRGLLCFSCNVAVGQLQHEPGRILRAAEYLDDDGERAELTALVRDRVRSLVRAGSD